MSWSSLSPACYKLTEYLDLEGPACLLTLTFLMSQDLVRDQSHKYFLTVLQDPSMSSQVAGLSGDWKISFFFFQHKTWAVFVLATVVQNFRPGQVRRRSHEPGRRLQ